MKIPGMFHFDEVQRWEIQLNEIQLGGNMHISVQ